ncbi:MAG: HNH endonuclease [Chloroflexota bacterium]
MRSGISAAWIAHTIGNCPTEMATKTCTDCHKEYRPLHGNSTRCRECWLRNRRRKRKVYSKQSSVKKKVIRRRGNRCENCGASGRDRQLHLHHVTPVSEGGETSADNTKLVCFDCHLQVEHGGSFS